MRTPYTIFFALMSIMLICSCDGCDNTAQISYADGQCNPPPLLLFPRGVNENAYNLPGTCGDPLFEHQVRLDLPITDSIFFQLENLSEEVFYRVYGLPTADGAPEELLSCQSTTSAFPFIGLEVASGRFDDIVLSVSRSRPTLSDLEENVIKVIAYQQRPQQQAINGDIAVNCDGERTQRLVIGTCNPNAFVGAWAREQGLRVVDSLPFSGFPGLVVVEVPPGIDPNSEPPTVREKIKQDTVNYFVENDFLIRLSPVALKPLSTFQTLLDGRRYYDVDTVEFPAQLLGPDNCAALNYDPSAPASTSGDDLTVAIIDSGADEALLASLWNNYRYQGATGPFLQPGRIGYDFVDGDDMPNDRLGHGTAVAATLLSQYRGTHPLTLLHYKIFDEFGTATYFGAITAIYAAIENGADIINLSWGISLDEAPQALQCAVDYANDRGVVIVTSAGNDTTDIDATPQWPAAFAGRDTFPNLVTVASYVDENNALSLASFSNFGDDNVTLAAYAAAEAPQLASAGGTDTYYGTSISTPIVARELARIMSSQPPPNGTVAIEQLLAILQDELDADLTQEDGRILPLQCNAVP